MTDITPRYGLPLLAAGQAQKEFVHNEAIAALDILANPAVQSAGLASPPEDPAPGDAWIIGDDPAGQWAGQAGAIAAWSQGGWRFFEAPVGMAVWLRDHERWIIRHSGGWDDSSFPTQALAVDGTIVVRAQRPAIPDPAGGDTIDAIARTAISAILSSLRAHGLIAL